MQPARKAPFQSPAQDDGPLICKVHYFDGTEDLEMSENLKFWLNKKIEVVTNSYNERMKFLKETNDKFYMQIQKFKILTQGSDFSLDQLDPVSLVQKLLVINNDPTVIWDAFEAVQPGFFAAVVQLKYSIGSNFSQVM